VFRDAAWEPARGDPPTPGFAAQVDLSALFVERSLSLAAGAGTVALLLPAKLWRSLSGGALRRVIATDCVTRALEDWSETPCAFDAAVYPSVLIASRRPSVESDAAFAVRSRSLDVTWRAQSASLRLDESDAASPWLLLPPEVRRAFDLVRNRGRPLGATTLRRATLGVKCGCNDAFIVTSGDCEQGLVTVEHRGRQGVLEQGMLRPLLRGDAVSAWRVSRTSRAIVWTHDAMGVPLTVLPGAAAKWLAPWRRRLRARTDLRGAGVWWTLFRTEAADSSRSRVVWSDFGRVPRAAILAPGDPTVPLNSCYVMSCDDAVDALALATLLNSPLAAAWLNAIAEPARGGWHRYLAWTVSLLPLPSSWARARELLAPLAERALVGDVPTDEELLLAACRAYRIRREDAAPLVAWCH
jgi:hypothetical protein